MAKSVLRMSLASGPGRAGAAAGTLSETLDLHVVEHVKYVQDLDTASRQTYRLVLSLTSGSEEKILNTG